MTLWCRVLALLAIIFFVVSNQSEDAKNRALDTSLENSLNLDHNHVITKRDAKDPEKTKRSKRKNGKRRKRLEKQKKDKASKKRSKKNTRGNKKKNGLKMNQGKTKKKQKAERTKKSRSKSTKKGKKKRNKKRNKNKPVRKRKNKGKKSRPEKKRKHRKNKTKLSQKKKQKWRNKRRKNGRKLSSHTSCSANQANYQCMEAALKGMMFEQQQITNYLKQSKLLQRHQSVSGNKRSKKIIFEEAEQHLLWAIGGDIDNPICGPSDTSSSKYNSTLYEKEKNLAVESYKILKECDIAIEQSCNISNLEGYNKDEVAENITICQDMMEDAIAANKLCQSLTEDVAAQCTCWINQTILIDQIKELKCQAKADQKKVTQFKNKCIETFKACKKMEDKSVESVYYCMEDHSMKFINQTVESLANAADKNSKTAGERAAFGDRNQLQLQEYLDDSLSLF